MGVGFVASALQRRANSLPASAVRTSKLLLLILIAAASAGSRASPDAALVTATRPALPDTFWHRSMFDKPKGKDALCHASAWDVTFNNDLRIKMCIKRNQEDLIRIHHELGHNYYFNNYYTLPVLYQRGANDGFHEAIGDTITLSVTRPSTWRRRAS